MTDPNKIVSINQYRLPYHLKEVAIDYVDKLLRSGVVRPSTSVFNSPLMLVKKPNSNPDKPLAEQYRLVHNYVELNKNKLVRKDSGFKAGALPLDAKKSFEALKIALISRPCLAPVNFKQPFIVTTDASETHYGSCLSQIGPDGLERPCGFSSKLLNEKESKQQPGIRERAALLHALRPGNPI